MATFAQVYDGQAHNVVEGESLDEALVGKFNDEWLKNQTDPVDEGGLGRAFTKIPDTDTNGHSTEHGAKDNGNGTFTNPAPAVPVAQYVALTKAGFEALLAANGSVLSAALAAWPKV